MRRCDCGVLNYTDCLVLGFTRHICNSLVLTIFVLDHSLLSIYQIYQTLYSRTSNNSKSDNSNSPLTRTKFFSLDQYCPEIYPDSSNSPLARAVFCFPAEFELSGFFCNSGRSQNCLLYRNDQFVSSFLVEAIIFLQGLYIQCRNGGQRIFSILYLISRVRFQNEVSQGRYVFQYKRNSTKLATIFGLKNLRDVILIQTTTAQRVSCFRSALKYILLFKVVIQVSISK